MSQKQEPDQKKSTSKSASGSKVKLKSAKASQQKRRVEQSKDPSQRTQNTKRKNRPVRRVESVNSSQKTESEQDSHEATKTKKWLKPAAIALVTVSVLGGGIAVYQSDTAMAKVNSGVVSVMKSVHSTGFEGKDAVESDEEVQAETSQALDKITREWTDNDVETIKKEIERQREKGLSIYVVQWGDTLSVLAEALDVTVSDLASANQIDDEDMILTGDLLTGVLNDLPISAETMETMEAEETPGIDLSKDGSGKSDKSDTDVASAENEPADSDDSEIEPDKDTDGLIIEDAEDQDSDDIFDLPDTDVDVNDDGIVQAPDKSDDESSIEDIIGGINNNVPTEPEGPSVDDLEPVAPKDSNEPSDDDTVGIKPIPEDERENEDSTDDGSIESPYDPDYDEPDEEVVDETNEGTATVRTYSERVNILHGVQYIGDPNRSVGEQEVVTEGKDGFVETDYKETTYEDDDDLIAPEVEVVEERTTDAVTEVIHVGTKQTDPSLGYIPVNYEIRIADSIQYLADTYEIDPDLIVSVNGYDSVEQELVPGEMMILPLSSLDELVIEESRGSTETISEENNGFSLETVSSLNRAVLTGIGDGLVQLNDDYIIASTARGDIEIDRLDALALDPIATVVLGVNHNMLKDIVSYDLFGDNQTPQMESLNRLIELSDEGFVELSPLVSADALGVLLGDNTPSVMVDLKLKESNTKAESIMSGDYQAKVIDHMVSVIDQYFNERIQ